MSNKGIAGIVDKRITVPMGTKSIGQKGTDMDIVEHSSAGDRLAFIRAYMAQLVLRMTVRT